MARLLLKCGMLSSLLYAAMLVVVPRWWDGYSSASQVVSELSAVGAPTRPLWVALGAAWMLLYAAGGFGVMASAGGSRAMRQAGAFMVAQSALSLYWPPMHQREVLAAGGATITDTLHIVWTAVNGVFTLGAMTCAAAALGARFRGYTALTVAATLLAGIMTGLASPRLEANLPTPLIGVWERVVMVSWLLWVVVLSAVLLRRSSAGAAGLPRVDIEMRPDHARIAIQHRDHQQVH